MFKKIPLKIFIIWLSSFAAHGQDSLSVRATLKYLCSEKCYGRGYIRHGLHQAEKYLCNEIVKSGALPLFDKKYTQQFTHAVNTFPTTPKVKLNGQNLIVGRDYIPNPGCGSVSGQFTLHKIDSVHYAGEAGNKKVLLNIKKKLTYSVAGEVKPNGEIDVLKGFAGEPQTMSISIKQKLVKQFKSNNLGCYVKGSSGSDSCIVFSAHYDHLGGIGKNCYFPGANDNASGVSMVLAMIKHYAQHPPKYNTVFLFFAGEEAGLLGSKYFVEHPAIDLHKILFLINLDLLGTGDDGIMVVNGAIHEKAFEKLQQINARDQRVKQIKKRGKAANSDHYWFSEAGVPCFFIYTMGGISAYHDIDDREITLPLTAYKSVFSLLLSFVEGL